MAIARMIKYLTQNYKFPLDIQGYANLYEFTKEYYHPCLSEDWGFIFEKIHNDLKFPLTPEVEKIINEEKINYTKKIIEICRKHKLEKSKQELLKKFLEEGYSLEQIEKFKQEIEEKIEEVINEGKEKISSVEFTNGTIETEKLERILNKWLVLRENKNNNDKLKKRSKDRNERDGNDNKKRF